MRSESILSIFFLLSFCITPSIGVAQEAVSCPGQMPDWPYGPSVYVGDIYEGPGSVTAVQQRVLANCQGVHDFTRTVETAERDENERNCSSSCTFSAQTPSNEPCQLTELTIIIDGGTDRNGAENPDRRCTYDYDEDGQLITPPNCDTIPGGHNDNRPHDHVSARAEGKMDMQESCTIKPIPFS